MFSIDHERVTEIIREAAASEIMPLWQNLEEDQVMDKGRGDLVTAADRACEEVLGKALRKLLARSLVVGEEAVAANPRTLAALDSEQPVWVLAPLDGTRNFANHRVPFAVMVCLILRGETLAAWIYDPLEETLVSAERSSGAFLEGTRVKLEDPNKPLEEMSGAVMTRYLPEMMRSHALSVRGRFASAVGSGCAGHDYRQLVTGAVDFLFYYRTLVWDHAPGTLIVGEAGGCARRYDCSPYVPVGESTGLICTAGEASWQRVRNTLVPDSG